MNNHIILYACLTAVVSAFIRAFFAGRSAARNRYKYPNLVPRHRKAAIRAYIITIASVAIIDIVVRMSGSPLYDILFSIHLSFSLLFLAGFTLLLWQNGNKNIRHGEIARITTGLLFWTAITAIPLIHRLPSMVIKFF